MRAQLNLQGARPETPAVNHTVGSRLSLTQSGLACMNPAASHVSSRGPLGRSLWLGGGRVQMACVDALDLGSDSRAVL